MFFSLLSLISSCRSDNDDNDDEEDLKKMTMEMELTCQSLSSRAALVAASSGSAISYTSVGIKPTCFHNHRYHRRHHRHHHHGHNLHNYRYRLFHRPNDNDPKSFPHGGCDPSNGEVREATHIVERQLTLTFRPPVVMVTDW